MSLNTICSFKLLFGALFLCFIYQVDWDVLKKDEETLEGKEAWQEGSNTNIIKTTYVNISRVVLLCIFPLKIITVF